MSDPRTLTEQEVNRLFDELPDLLEREEGVEPVVSTMPDGTYWEYKDDLRGLLKWRLMGDGMSSNTKRDGVSFAPKISAPAQHSG